MSQQADHLSELVAAFKLDAAQIDGAIAANDAAPVIDITPSRQRLGQR
jgi:methyl-accepting chemotaxis protein